MTSNQVFAKLLDKYADLVSMTPINPAQVDAARLEVIKAFDDAVDIVDSYYWVTSKTQGMRVDKRARNFLVRMGKA